MTDDDQIQGGAPRRFKHTDVLRRHLDLADRTVLEIGCGDGALVRFMARHGAIAYGLEISEDQLARALAVDPVDGAAYVVSRGEALPVADRALDILVLFNSLHHLPVAELDLALAEAARVLRPGGFLYVMEPMPEGRFFELVRTVEDEFEVRKQAERAIGRAANTSFEQIVEQVYEAPIKLADFADFRRRVVAVDPARCAAFDAQAASLEDGFHACAERKDDAYWFWQPSRLNLLKRV